MLGLVKVNDRLTAQQVKERDAFNKSQLFSTQTHKKFNMQELTNIMVKQKLKEKIFEQKVQTYIELVRRKLDVEIIKDNFQNEKTKEVLDQFTFDESSRNRYNFRSHKFKEVLEQREDQLVRLEAERRMHEQYNKELLHSSTQREKRQVEARFAARKASVNGTHLPDVNSMRHQTLSDIIMERGKT